VIVLAADIGGTNSRLALVELDGAGPRLIERMSAPSRSLHSLGAVTRKFLDGKRVPTRACFAVAGPVANGMVKATNLPWIIESRALATEIGIPETLLINDFAAIGEAIPLLATGDLASLQTGVRNPTGPIALIGAGTGLGEGFLFHDGNGYRVCESEGGHATFAARTEREWRVYSFLETRVGPVSWERVLSGPGLVAVYDCLSETSSGEEPAAISARGLAGTDPVAAETLDLFAAAYGAQAGNLALTVLATGGVYIAGGIAPKLIAKLRDDTFMAAFRSKGELEPFLARVPVDVIMNPDAGLLGAAAVAARGFTTANGDA
jgi:glucokinase